MTQASRAVPGTDTWLVPDDLSAALQRDGFSLGPWRVEPRQRHIVSARDSRRLDPRLMDLLVFLAARSGRLVAREEILDAVWADAVVSENTLTQAVSRLRRALGDASQSPQFIETVSKSGYRLITAVEWPARSQPAAVEAPTATRQSKAEQEAQPSRAIPTQEEPTTEGPRAARSRLAVDSAFAAVLIPAVLVVVVLIAVFLIGGANRQLRSESEQLARVPEVTPALTHPGNQFEPTLSPDGQHAAFAWLGPEQEEFDIWVQRLDTHQPVRLTEHAGHERLPTWSPDGLSLAYAHVSEEEKSCGIYCIPLIGGSPSRLADCPNSLRSLHWSPAGDTLVLSAAQAPGEAPSVYLLDLATGSQRQLSWAPEGIVGDQNAKVSPDGRWVAFERRHSPFRHQVMVVSSEGGNERALTDEAWGRLRGLAWSSDSSSVIHSSNRSGRYLLWKVSLDAGEPARLPVEDAWVTQPSVAHGQGRLLYRTFRDSVDLYSLTLASPGVAAGEPRQILPSTRSERDPVWSPDGLSVAFRSDRSGSQELWLGGVEGNELRQLTDFQGPQPESAAWSRDGRHLVFDAAVAGHADLWRVGRDSQKAQPLTKHPGNERNPSFSSDGTTIYFASDRDGAWDIYRMPADGGPAQRVTHSGAFYATETPDGSHLLSVHPERREIWMQALLGTDPSGVGVLDASALGAGAPDAAPSGESPPGVGPAGEPTTGDTASDDSRLLVADLALADWGSWTAGKTGVYFLRRSPTAIHFQPYDGSPSRLVYQPPKQMPFLARNLSLSPDESQLLLAWIEHSDDEVMRVDLDGL